MPRIRTQLAIQAPPDLLARVEALEAAVSDLQRPASPERVSPAALPSDGPITNSGDFPGPVVVNCF